MLRSYLKIAFRNLYKRKGYALLNILGLAIGIACCLMIFQYVSFERSFDKQLDHSGPIVRLRMDSYQQGKLSWQSATIYPAIGPTFQKDYPEVMNFCRLHDADMVLSNDEKQVKFKEEKGYFADPSFLPMFNIKLIKGNIQSALDGPDKILLSESMAGKYFGAEEPIGKRLVYRNPAFTRTLEVSGVFKDYPANSHLVVNHLVSYKTLGAILRNMGDTSNATETSFGWYDFYTYLQLKPGTDLKKFESKFPVFCDKYINSGEWPKANNVRNELFLLPVGDIHLYSNYNQEAEVNGNGKVVSIIYLIAFIILVIAWINYVNMATARSVERAREVGVRKVMGALRNNLINQFMLESLLLNGIALLIALSATILFTPFFNNLIGKPGTAGFRLEPKYWELFSVLFAAGTLLSGLYPAFVLSSYQPVKVLKGLFRNSSSGIVLRKGLTVVQFAASVIMIVGTLIIFQQVNFMRRQDLGVDITHTLVLQGAASVGDSLYQNSFQPFKNELLQLSGVKNVSASSSVMGREIYWTQGIRRISPNNPGAVTLYHLGIDYDFIPSFNMKLVAGRNFSKDFSTDDRAALLNETAVNSLGFGSPQQAINGKVLRSGDTINIIGVVQNFHQEGLRKSIQPQIFILTPNARDAYSIKLETANIQQSIAGVETIWKKNFPNDPFNYYFLDDAFDAQYRSDRLSGQVFGLFASLAILIACFGLLGLSAYNILQRTKEIGIRKVMGASIRSLLILLSKDFLLLVFASFLLSIPVAWWMMHQWLQDFAYRINIQWWVFVVAGFSAILIALSTIGYQAIRAALANPVKSLRTE